MARRARAVQLELQGAQRSGQLVLVHPAHVADAHDSTLQPALATARTQQQARVAALQAELDQAQRALKDLG